MSYKVTIVVAMDDETTEADVKKMVAAAGEFGDVCSVETVR